MIITASTQQLELEDAERAYIESVSHKLSDRFLHIFSLRWKLTSEKSNVIVKCLVHSQSGYFHARAAADKLKYAVDLVFEKILSQRQKKRQRIYPQRMEINRGYFYDKTVLP
jgi:ribosome-associated translation inhibitor RaiA